MRKTTKYSLIATVAAAVLAGIIGATVNINIENGKYNASIEYSEEAVPATVEDDMGEIIEVEKINGEEIPTVEEVDGGLFEDWETGTSVLEGDYDDLGAAVETFDTKTPEAFKNATLGHCVYANNRFGAQCVSLARSFWWSYANRDVSTCGTGMAKGMMNCWQQNAGNDFLVYWKGSANKIQSGDWLVFDGGQYGHVCMSLGPDNNGYVACLGENQGGRSCPGGGAATNIINISLKNLIGFYRPKSYMAPEPKPAPTPAPTPKPTPKPGPTGTLKYMVKKGDTLGAILRAAGYTGRRLYGNNGLAQKIADVNGIKNRDLIYPKQVIVIDKSLFALYQ